MSPWHTEELRNRWLTFPLLDQLGHIGGEVHRTMTAQDRGDDRASQHAFERALELFDFTLDDPRWRFPRKKEIARAREVFCDLIVGGNTYGTDPESLDRYFTQFAIAAQRQRGL